MSEARLRRESLLRSADVPVGWTGGVLAAVEAEVQRTTRASALRQEMARLGPPCATQPLFLTFVT
jgi:hypothetical protein